MTAVRFRSTALMLLLLVLILAPRLPKLGQFVTPDERKWLARSANFAYARFLWPTPTLLAPFNGSTRA
ncbi:MAG: hypothetical protein Q9O62_14085 [Ardenticatenia bacterium]|nr:hypothetical protein [Ardenticatenia bacterium]